MVSIHRVAWWNRPRHRATPQRFASHLSGPHIVGRMMVPRDMRSMSGVQSPKSLRVSGDHGLARGAPCAREVTC